MITAEQTQYLETLSLQDRREMLLALQDYSASDFPGSKRWLHTQSVNKLIAEFDAAHPEIIGAIRAKNAARNHEAFIHGAEAGL